MSLARAFTVRRNKPSDEGKPASSYISRAASQRAPNAKPIERHQISLPVALISTTNMLSYEAPDIEGTIRIANTIREVPSQRSISGNSSCDESDRSDRSSTSGRSQSQDTDATSVDGGESPILPEHNHLSSYFKPNVYSQAPIHNRTESTASSQPADSPMIPQRAPSHSMKAHVLSHKRSIRRIASPPSPRSPRKDTFSAPTETAQAPSAPSSHPFGKELEQLNEAAEEFGFAVRDAEANADMQIMNAKGLIRFCAAEYMQELSGLYTTAFSEDHAAYKPVAWI